MFIHQKIEQFSKTIISVTDAEQPECMIHDSNYPNKVINNVLFLHFNLVDFRKVL